MEVPDEANEENPTAEAEPEADALGFLSLFTPTVLSRGALSVSVSGRLLLSPRPSSCLCLGGGNCRCDCASTCACLERETEAAAARLAWLRYSVSSPPARSGKGQEVRCNRCDCDRWDMNGAM